MVNMKSRTQEIEIPEKTPFVNDKLERAMLCDTLTDVVSFYGQSGCVMALSGEWDLEKRPLLRCGAKI